MDATVEFESDSEEEFMDVMEEIPNPKPPQTFFNAIKTGCQAVTEKIMQLYPLGDNRQNNIYISFMYSLNKQI